jgi:hypothetical protein
MLTRVMQTLASGSVVSHADLARQLDVSEDMLAHMLGDLVRKGYVVSLAETGSDHSCGGGCGGCGSCRLRPSNRRASQHGWALTAKGLRYASR